jgi:thymidylate synthase
MYNKTWNMITIVLQESPSNEEKLFSNRTNCKIYFKSIELTYNYYNYHLEIHFEVIY